MKCSKARQNCLTDNQLYEEWKLEKWWGSEESSERIKEIEEELGLKLDIMILAERVDTIGSERKRREDRIDSLLGGLLLGLLFGGLTVFICYASYLIIKVSFFPI